MLTKVKAVSLARRSSPPSFPFLTSACTSGGQT